MGIHHNKEEKKERNVKKISNFECIKTIEGFEHGISSMCNISNTKFAACSLMGAIKIFDTETFGELLTMEPDKKGISYVDVLKNGNLITAGYDKKIRIWKLDVKGIQLVDTIDTQFEGPVMKAIEMSEDRIGACSTDSTIEIFDNQKNILKILKGHKEDVMSIIELSSKTHLVSAGKDGTVRFWDNQTYDCQTVFPGMECIWNTGLKEVGDVIVIGGKERVSIISLKDFQFHKYITYKRLVTADTICEIEKNVVVCGCNFGGMDSFIEIDIETEELIDVKNNVHDDALFSIIRLENGDIATCSYDKTIKIWRFLPEGLLTENE